MAAVDPPLALVRIEAVGTAFRAILSNGSVKEGRELVGTVLVFQLNGKPIRIRIASITPDPLDPTGAVLLHDFRVDETGEPLCNAAPDGTRLGFPLAGRSANGLFVPDPAVFELICTAGAQGKCVRFGYHPWEESPERPLMPDYYNACVRLVRADYCGDGRAWTRNGTSIDLWDDLKIQRAETGNGSGFSFEAGWSKDGAVCVARTRIPENITLSGLKEFCPRLAIVPVCTEGVARGHGALIYNNSQ